jgi:PDZ domain
VALDCYSCRSGALRIGDRILAVDGVSTSSHSADEVYAMIQANRTQRINVELLPITAIRKLAPRVILAGNTHDAYKSAAVFTTWDFITPDAAEADRRCEQFGLVDDFAKPTV